jgi:hypothetical protein
LGLFVQPDMGINNKLISLSLMLREEVNMKEVSICLFILLSAFRGWSQDLTQKKFRFDQLSVSMGGELGTQPLLMSRQDFSKLAPGSLLYPETMREDIRMGSMVSWNATILNFQLGWTPLVGGFEESRHRTWRIGLMAQGFQSSLYSRVDESTFRVDTLYQGSTNNIYGFLDSTERFMSNGFYKATAIKLDLAHIWSTANDRRLSLFAGLGGNAGVNVSPRTEVLSNRWSVSELRDTYGKTVSTNAYFNSNTHFEGETFQNKTGFSTALYIPLGIDFRVGNKRTYLMNLHLFSEVRPTLNWLYVPETRMYVFPTIQSTVGLRWWW